MPGLTGGVWTFGQEIMINGTVATAMSIEGTHSTAGLSITGTHASGQALIIGTGISTPVSFTGNNLVEWHGRVSAATSSHPLLRCRCSALATAMTGGLVQAGQFQAYGTNTSDVGNLLALEGVVGIKGASTLIGTAGVLPNMLACWLKCEDLGNTITVDGDTTVLALGWQFGASSTFTGDTAWIKLMKEGADTTPVDAFLEVYDGAGGGFATVFLDMPAALPYDAANSSNTQSGKIACTIGGATKYIQCYSD